MIVSSAATTSLEEIHRAAPEANQWFQLYVLSGEVLFITGTKLSKFNQATVRKTVLENRPLLKDLR